MKKWDEIERKLEKLRRNEIQMSPAQFLAYKDQIGRFKSAIFTQAKEVLKDFLVSGIRYEMDDIAAKDLFGAIKRICREEVGSGGLERLRGVLFSTYSLNAFLSEAVGWRDRILFEAYAPYWCAHVAETGDSAYPYRSDLAGMRWRADWGLWEAEDGKSWALMLPPTRGQMEGA